LDVAIQGYTAPDGLDSLRQRTPNRPEAAALGEVHALSAAWRKTLSQ
jgi:hypothetical protein